jgi:multiple sugar transport system substrate-binding protein
MHPRSRTLCRVAAEGWLAHWLDFAAGRWLPPRPAPLEQPFWLDPGDPHRMQSAVQVLGQPHVWSPYPYGLGREEAIRAEQEGPFLDLSTSVHRIVADGLTPEQAVDELIAQAKQLLGE